MKNITLVCLLITAFSLYADPAQEDYRNANTKARVSYSFGMLFGSNLSAYPLEEFDYAAFTEGFRTMFEKAEPQFTPQEAEEYVENAMRNAVDRINEENRIKEENFLAANSQREEVHITPSGLQYEVLVETNGEKPTIDSTVRVKYTGSFIDGSVFDSSRDDGVFFPLNMIIEGWTEGLMLMSPESKYIIYIPSSLAYGPNGVQNLIPPYSTLIFEVELLEILSGEEEAE